MNDRVSTNTDSSGSLLEINKLSTSSSSITIENPLEKITNSSSTSEEKLDPRTHRNSLDYSQTTASSAENNKPFTATNTAEQKINVESAKETVGTSAQKKPELIKKHTADRISTCSNTSSVFEPVSPINEDDLRSPKDESGMLH